MYRKKEIQTGFFLSQWKNETSSIKSTYIIIQTTYIVSPEVKIYSPQVPEHTSLSIKCPVYMWSSDNSKFSGQNHSNNPYY